MTKVTIIIILIFLILFGLFFLKPVLAQEIFPEELEVKTPLVLPDSNIYFFKDFFRQLRLVFTFSPIKRAELRLRMANEKLIEVKKLTEKETKQEFIERALTSYQQELEKLKNQIEKLPESEKEKFLEKYVRQSLKQQMVLENIASQVKGEVYEKILVNREKHLERFKEVMEKIQNKEMVQEKIRQAVLDVFYVSPPRAIKILESIEEIKENLPEELKEKIEEIKIEMIKKAKETFQVFPTKTQVQKIEEQLRTFANPLMAQKIIEEIKEKDVVVPPEEVRILPQEILQEKLTPLSEEKQIEVLEKIVNQRIQHLEKLEEIKEKLEKLPESAQASGVLKKVIERQMEKLEKKIEKIEGLPETIRDQLKEELKASPKIRKEIMKRVPGVMEKLESKIESKEIEIKPPLEASRQARLSGFCGWATYALCKTNEDCLSGGCSHQICHGKNEERTITTCEWRDCYKAEAYGLKCGCFQGKCQWGK
ncbi:MAG: eight-cysteine-cluster domain-containing protein [Patescibacteria group bacterium]|nr:eight-cysteine-cluster domain-containing protein [Patescibacteria group bacterium]